MAVITDNLELTDDYSAEVIRLARERSPSIDAWIVEQRYLIETPEDNLSPLWLRNRCIIKICEELGEMGIQLHRDPDLICDEPQMVYAVLMLRKKFDSDALFELFRDHLDLVADVKSDMGEGLVENIIAWSHDNLPLDEGWGLLSDTLESTPNIFDGDTLVFMQRVRQVLEQLDSLGEPDVTAEQDPELVLKYVNFLAKRNNYILETASSVWATHTSGEFEKSSRRRLLEGIMNGGFEKHLGTRACINRVLGEFESVDLNDPEQVSKFLRMARAPYKKLWNTCFEYYGGEEKKRCPDSVLAIVFATLVVDAPSQLTVRTWIDARLHDYEEILGTEAITQIREHFNVFWTNLINPVEINYAT